MGIVGFDEGFGAPGFEAAVDLAVAGLDEGAVEVAEDLGVVGQFFGVGDGQLAGGFGVVDEVEVEGVDFVGAAGGADGVAEALVDGGLRGVEGGEGLSAFVLFAEGVLHGGAQVAAASLGGEGADGGDAGDGGALAVEAHGEGPGAEGGGELSALEDAGAPLGAEEGDGVALGTPCSARAMLATKRKSSISSALAARTSTPGGSSRGMGGSLLTRIVGGERRAYQRGSAEEAECAYSESGLAVRSQVPMKILIADDEPHIRELVRLYLSREGYELEFAVDGREALEKGVSTRPDLIVLDLMMPKLDGFEVTKALRKHSDVPILMLTVRREDTVKVAGLELGADDYLTKPFNPKELVARVKAILRRSDGIQRSGVEVQVGSLTLNRQQRRRSSTESG